MRPYLWRAAGVIIGAGVGVSLRVYAVGVLRRDAIFIGALAGLIAWGLQAVRLRPPPPSPKASLTRGQRRGLLICLGLGALALGAQALAEARRGYPTLRPDALLEDETPAGFATARGIPLVERFYRIEGEEGRRYLYPLDAYGGRLVMIVAEPIEAARPVVVTGRLREDVRAVQRAEDGEIHGPFLPLYRAQMGLPPKARVLFLDTQARAGLGTLTLCALIGALYALLLTWSAPTRKTL